MKTKLSPTLEFYSLTLGLHKDFLFAMGKI